MCWCGCFDGFFPFAPVWRVWWLNGLILVYMWSSTNGVLMWPLLMGSDSMHEWKEWKCLSYNRSQPLPKLPLQETPCTPGASVKASVKQPLCRDMWLIIYSIFPCSSPWWDTTAGATVQLGNNLRCFISALLFSQVSSELKQTYKSRERLYLGSLLIRLNWLGWNN